MEQMLDLHAQCLVLKRILDKKVNQHASELDAIDQIRKIVQESDGLLVDEYKRQLIEKREEVHCSNELRVGITEH